MLSHVHQSGSVLSMVYSYQRLANSKNRHCYQHPGQSPQFPDSKSKSISHKVRLYEKDGYAICDRFGPIQPFKNIRLCTTAFPEEDIAGLPRTLGVLGRSRFNVRVSSALVPKADLHPNPNRVRRARCVPRRNPKTRELSLACAFVQGRLRTAPVQAGDTRAAP